MPREYPPAVLVHAETCEDVINLRLHGESLIPMATPDVARAYVVEIEDRNYRFGIGPMILRVVGSAC